MLSLILFSLFVNRYYCSVIHNDIGVIEITANDNGNNNKNDMTEQQDLLRRRLMPGGLTTQDKTTLLNTHNKLRNYTAQGQTYGQPSASNMNQLIWDAGLAAVAQAYSEQCIWGHNPNRNQDLLNYLGETSFQYTNQEVGENLFITTGSESLSVLLQGIQYWYDEYTYYTFGTTSGTASCQSGEQCGHYTQLVWGNTRYVGCGYTKCPTTSGVSFTNGILFVCNYYFAGNVVGYPPYETGSSATSCASDRSPDNGLCSGCPNSDYDTYCCEYCSESSCSNAENSGLLTSPSSCTNGLGTAISNLLTNVENELIGSQSTASTTTTVTPTSMPTHMPTTPSPTTPSPTTAHPTTAHPTTASPTAAHTTTASPTAAHTTTTHAATASSKQCCKAVNSRYTTFCDSISTSEICGTFSSLCSWGNSC